MTVNVNQDVADSIETPTAMDESEPQRHVSDRDDKRRIVINAGSNAGVMAAKVAVVFFCTPILVHNLGDTRYGIWMFVSSFTAYLALGDFGLKGAVMRFVARHDGLADRDGINRVFNTGLAILTCMGAVVIAISALLTYFWWSPSSVPADLNAETRRFFLLSGVLVAMLLPGSVPNSLLAGLGRFPARNAVSLLSLFMRQALLVGVVWCGGKLVTVGIVLVSQCVLDFAMIYWMARRCFPQLTCSLRYVDRATAREICGYGFHLFVGDVAFLAICQSAPLLIGAFLHSPKYITYFSLGASLKDYALSILGTLAFVLIPAISKWQATNNYAAIRSVLIHATRHALYFTAPIEVGLLSLGYPFLKLWMGREYADACYVTLAILSVPLALSAVGMVASRFLQGIGKVRALAILTIVQAVLTVGLGAALVRPFGIAGVAWGFSLAVALCALPTAILVCRSVHVGVANYLLSASAGPIAASAVAGCAWWGAQRCIHIDNWIAFVAVGIIGMAPYGVVVLLAEPDIRKMSGRLLRQYIGKLTSASTGPIADNGAASESSPDVQLDDLSLPMPACAIEK
jgi:O-antigen/teichoic acid export membrane protein